MTEKEKNNISEKKEELDGNNTPIDYNVLLEERFIYNKDITSALEIVRQFIIKKKLILAGGTGLDYLLKLKGDEIYDPKRLPDYDFYSPNHLEDSCELANELYRLGFTNITNINAVHATTRRVRVNFFPVADITYLPENIYSIIPIIKLNDGMLVRGPEMIRIDMHRSLSLPYENKPKEVILHRWKKDIERFNKLNTNYPVSLYLDKHSQLLTTTHNEQDKKGLNKYKELKKKEMLKQKPSKTKIYKKPTQKLDDDEKFNYSVKIYPSFIKDTLVSGYIAYNIFTNIYHYICNHTNETPQIQKQEVDFNYKNKKNNPPSIKTKIPINEVCLISNNFYETGKIIKEKMTKKYEKHKKNMTKEIRIEEKEKLITKLYNSFLDNKPKSIKISNYEIYDNRFNLLAMNEYKNIKLPSVHSICIYLLYKYIKTKEKYHLEYYDKLLLMIEHVNLITKSQIELVNNNSNLDNLNKVQIKKIPFEALQVFSLTTNVYGNKNISQARLRELLKFYKTYYPNENIELINNLVPRDQFPTQSKECPIFDKTKSIFFDIDDEEVSDFNNLETLYKSLQI